MSSPAAPTRRRWLQFGIGTMLWLIALLAVSTLAIREYRERKRIEDEFSNEREQLKAQIVERADLNQKLRGQYDIDIRRFVDLLSRVQNALELLQTLSNEADNADVRAAALDVIAKINGHAPAESHGQQNSNTEARVPNSPPAPTK